MIMQRLGEPAAVLAIFIIIIIGSTNDNNDNYDNNTNNNSNNDNNNNNNNSPRTCFASPRSRARLTKFEAENARSCLEALALLFRKEGKDDLRCIDR